MGFVTITGTGSVSPDLFSGRRTDEPNWVPSTSPWKSLAKIQNIHKFDNTNPELIIFFQIPMRPSGLGQE